MTKHTLLKFRLYHIVFFLLTKYNTLSVDSYLKMMPSLAMEYNILGSGTSDPSKDEVSPHSAPISITYLAQGAPFIANTSDNVTGRVL